MTSPAVHHNTIVPLTQGYNDVALTTHTHCWQVQWCRSKEWWLTSYYNYTEHMFHTHVYATGISGTSIIAGISITLVSVVSASRWYQHHTGIGIMLHQYYVWFPELGLSLPTWLCISALFGFCNNGLLCVYLGLVRQFSPRFSLVFTDLFDESTHVLYGCQSNIQHSATQIQPDNCYLNQLPWQWLPSSLPCRKWVLTAWLVISSSGTKFNPYTYLFGNI